MRTKQIAAALACALAVSAAGFLRAAPVAPVALVKDGTAKAVIVLPDDANLSEQLAAKELSVYAEKITGAKIPVSKEVPAGFLPIRFALTSKPLPVRDSAFERAVAGTRDDGFVIRAGEKDGILIAGPRPRSILYGAYHILRSNGVIWFHPDPTEEGEYVPKSEDLTVPAGITAKNPAFGFRKFTLNGGSRKNAHVYTWFLRNGMQLVLSGRPARDPSLLALDPIRTTGGHDMGGSLVGAGKGSFASRRAALLKEHPEYFGLVGGKRVIAGNDAGACQPCTSNPETLGRMLGNIRRTLSAFGGGENIRSFCNDDHTVWCECENCKKLDDPEAPRSNRHAERWWRFVNHMAENLLSKDNPNQKVMALVYQTYRFPPRLVKPDPRVPVVICPHQRCYIHSLTDPACPANASTFRKMFDEWAATGQKATTFEFHTQMPGATRYLPMERAWIEDLRYYKKLNMYGFGFITRAALSDFGAKGNKDPFNVHMWMSLWQQHFLTAHFAWELDDDVEKVLEDINSKYYGPAWKYMKPYREELTKALYAPKVHMGYGTSDAVLGKCLESAGLLERLRGYLDKAEKEVADNPLCMKRVGRDRLFLKLSWENAYDLYKSQKQKEYTAKRAKTPLALDGKLDEDVWRTAEPATDFRVFENGKLSASPQTFVRILYDDTNLYFGIECLKPKSGAIADKAEKDGIPYAMKGSHIEIFLAPLALNGKYYHFGVAHNGKTFRALTTSGSSRDEGVGIDFKAKITEASDRWIAEIKAPVGKFVKKISDGETWKINIARSAMTDSGKMQASSWSGGVFHGAETYRTVAFGESGAFLKNGDFEDVGKPRIKKHLKRQWTYVSGDIPLRWAFNENNTGSVEIRTDGAPSGKNYLRISGTNAFFGQYGGLKNAPKELSVTMRVRGRGEILTRIFGKKKEGFKTKLDSPDQWTVVAGNIKVPENPVAIWFRVTGTVDFDDIRFAPANDADDDMPTAEKHK